MANAHEVQPRIVTVMKKTRCTYREGAERVLKASYCFYLHLGEAPCVGKEELGGTIASVKRVPRMFSEVASAMPEEHWAYALPSFGKIDYELAYDEKGIEAMTVHYHPKNNGKMREVKRLGYYLDSIATSHVAREFGARTISTTSTPDKLRREQLMHVGLRVEPYFGMSVYAIRKYLLAMGRGVREKVEIARSAVPVLQ